MSTSIPHRAIVFLSLAAFASAATVRISDPLLPQLAVDFRVSLGEAAGVVTGFAAAYGLLQAIYGPLGDRFGKYKLVLIGTLVSGATTASCALAGSLVALTALRIGAGATAAVIIPLSLAWIGDVVPYQNRQAMLARFMSGQVLGLVFGQIVGGVIGERFGWRMAFIGIASVFLVAAAGLASEFRANPATRLAPPAGPRESLGRAYLHSFDILKRPWVRTILVCVFMEGLATFGAFAYVGGALHARFGIGFGVVGALLGAYGVGGFLYTLIARRLVPLIGETGLAACGGALICASFIGLAVLSAWQQAAIPIFGIGLGFYMLHNTLQTNGTQMAPDARGVAMSFFAASFYIGQSVGVFAISLVIDRTGAAPAFLTAAAIMLALGFALARAIRGRAGMADSIVRSTKI